MQRLYNDAESPNRCVYCYSACSKELSITVLFMPFLIDLRTIKGSLSASQFTLINKNMQNRERLARTTTVSCSLFPVPYPHYNTYSAIPTQGF